MDAGLLQSATKYGMDYLAFKDHNAFAWLSLNPLGNHWNKTLDQNESKETNPSRCSAHYGTVFQWLLHQDTYMHTNTLTTDRIDHILSAGSSFLFDSINASYKSVT